MQVWLFSVAQCVLSVSVIGVNVRLCFGSSDSDTEGSSKTVSICLKLCLAWVGAVGGAVEVPVNVLLNLRSPQCLYTCITLLCCPMLVRHFTICLLLLLTINAHFQCRLGHRYTSLVTRQHMTYLVLLSWVCSVVTAFAQFIVYNSPDTWQEVSSEMGLGENVRPNHTTPKPPPKLPYPQDRSVIGKHLPYGGFLSKFLMEDLHNFTYEEIHRSHWSVCAPDTVLSPAFLVYVYAVAVFLIPLLVLLAVYLDLMCLMPLQAVTGFSEVKRKSSGHSHSLALSLSLLVLLCLPKHTVHTLHLFAPSTQIPNWVTYTASILFQLYGLVPPLLFTQSTNKVASVDSSLLVAPLKPVTALVNPLNLTPVEFYPLGLKTKSAATLGV